MFRAYTNNVYCTKVKLFMYAYISDFIPYLRVWCTWLPIRVHCNTPVVPHYKRLVEHPGPEQMAPPPQNFLGGFCQLLEPIILNGG